MCLQIPLLMHFLWTHLGGTVTGQGASPPEHEQLWCPSASLLQSLCCSLSWSRYRIGRTLSGFKTCLQPKLCSQNAAEAVWGSSELGTWVLFMTEVLCDLEQLPAPLSHSPASPAAESGMVTPTSFARASCGAILRLIECRRSFFPSHKGCTAMVWPSQCFRAGWECGWARWLPEGALFPVSAGGNICRIGTPVKSFMSYHMATVQINYCSRSVMRVTHKTVTDSTATWADAKKCGR